MKCNREQHVLGKSALLWSDWVMKLLFDFFPVLLFFITYKMYDIYTATAVLIAASAIQTIGHRLIKGSFEKTHVITFVLVAIFGGLTLFLQNELFIKWKPTVINWLFAVAFIGSQFIGRLEAATKVGDFDAIVPSIEGWAKVTGYNTIIIDDDDPYAHGFQVI